MRLLLSCFLAMSCSLLRYLKPTRSLSTSKLTANECLQVNSINSVHSAIAVTEKQLAETYNLQYIPSPANNVPSHVKYILHFKAEENILQLQKLSKVKENPFYIDFLSGRWKERLKVARSELLTKAIGKAEVVVDLTAGIGRDSMILAASGKKMVLVEQNLILYLLLQNALQRLLQSSPKYQNNIYLIHGRSQDSFEAVQEKLGLLNPRGSGKVSVYLDPMYPIAMDDRKAKVKKETQIIHDLLSLSGLHFSDETKSTSEENDRQLFQLARSLATDRVVVKRDLHCPPLSLTSSESAGAAPILPHSKVEGSGQRFDVFFVPQLR